MRWRWPSTAEGFAEMLHSDADSLGFPDPPELPISEKLKAATRHPRVVGYPANRSADQVTLFRPEPETFGLTLTEGFMMDPEVLAGVVFHHPAAKYFND
jgi:cobalamin-dependent methionine synthase I